MTTRRFLLLCSTALVFTHPAPAQRPAPAPLFRDPIHDGAADATMVWNREEKCWWMLYTNRRADADGEKGVKWVHGTDLGIASTPDGGATWKYRGIARGLEFEKSETRNTFWAPEVVDSDGKYHAFISYVRVVPETWDGSRDILHYTSTNLIYFVHQAEKEPAYRHTWLQVAKLGFDGTTLTCDRDAEFDFQLKQPAPEFTPEHVPAAGK